MITASITDNLWVLLALSFGEGYGQVLPAMRALAASLINIKNSGIILGLGPVANNISLIIGPMVHGLLYGVNKSYPFYLGGICV